MERSIELRQKKSLDFRFTPSPQTADPEIIYVYFYCRQRNTISCLSNICASCILQVVLVTGVGGSSNQWQTQQQAYLARQAGIHVVAVGAGRWLDRYELGNIVSQPRTVNAIFADSFATLQRDASSAVRNIICNSKYWVFFTPPMA